MTLAKLLGWSESFTDEIQTTNNALSYANNAIAEVNTEVGLLLPFIEDISTVYTALPDSWFVRLLVPYLNYGIKMNDTSINEAMVYKQQFDIALIKFKDVARNLVDEEFINPDEAKMFQMDSSNSIDLGWFGGRR